MPNSLGYCGPDDRGTILHHLETGKGGEELVSTLKEFEAAYPFLRLIARTTGREVFDYSVPEAYWIGNGLLERVPVPDFYRFSHRELKGRKPAEVRRVFKELGGRAVPHHSFHVMTTYASSSLADGPSVSNTASDRIAQLIDDCRISWGRVLEVRPKTLRVGYTPVKLDGGKLAMGKPATKTVNYNREVTPFGRVKAGDAVSLHWGYACEVLTPGQLRNLKRYTSLDMELTNGLLEPRT